MSGKNFSRNTNASRDPRDFYQTPYSMTDQLLDRLESDEGFGASEHFPILEPACGDNAIVRRLAPRFGGISVIARDLSIGWDFLRESRTFPTIITNPPYSIAEAFIDQCKRVAVLQFALLLPLDYVHGKDRYHRFYEKQDGIPLRSIYVFTRRPLLSETIREDGTYPTGMMTYAWFYWKRSYRGEPVMRWIDNNAFVRSERNTRRAAESKTLPLFEETA
jgi:hypothetical protein